MWPRPKQPIVLSQSGIPMILPSSGTIGNNGALSALTALPTIYASCYMYFPVNTIAAGVAAGMYYVVMSSTTAGTIYNNVYTTGEARIPATPTPFVTTGPGAYTQTTGAPITLSTTLLPAGLMGIDGQLISHLLWSHPNNGNNKIETFALGGTTVSSWTQTTTVQASYCVRVANRQNYAKQVVAPDAVFGASATALTYLTKDTSTDLNITRTAQLAVATDYIVLESTCCTVAAED